MVRLWHLFVRRLDSSQGPRGHCPDVVDVDLGADTMWSCHQFGGPEGASTEHLARERQRERRLTLWLLDQAPIGDHPSRAVFAAVIDEQDVARRDVAMNVPSVMGVLQGAGDTVQDAH